MVGSSDAEAAPRGTPCEFNSCPAGSPAEGFNATNPDLNYVNSFPVTSMKYGINTLAPASFESLPEITVAGPNVGGNLGLVAVQFSGTVGAATYAAGTANIPAIAFSGQSGTPTAWDASPPSYSQIYADLATNITNLIIDGGAPYLPTGTFLNVNFPDAGDGTSCTNIEQFKFILSRIVPLVSLLPPSDVEQCGTSRLPSESSVIERNDCYVSISVGDASNKLDSGVNDQTFVRDRLRKYLSCLPS